MVHALAKVIFLMMKQADPEGNEEQSAREFESPDQLKDPGALSDILVHVAAPFFLG